MSADAITLFRADGASVADIERLADHIVRFGDDVVVLAPEHLAPFAWATSPQFSVIAAGVPRTNLHLLVQKHDEFQKTHPDIEVLARYGRYLILSVNPAIASLLEGPHFTVAPLGVPHTVYWEPPRPASVTPSPAVSAFLERLSRARMQRDIEHLVALGTRESTTREYVMAAQWTASQLRDCGFTVELKEIAVGSARSYNVVAVRHGSGPTPRVRMLATAHLDSIGDRQGRPAPGADDNATGVAGVLELARCLADRDLPYDLELVLFGGEEQGLVGSKAYVKELPTPPRIRGVVNMDMIGSNIETPGHTLMIQSVELFEWLIDALVTAAHTYTTLTLQVSTSHPRLNSDHLPFIRKFIPAVLLIEGNGKANPRMHSQRDTPAHLDYDLILQILRAHLAFLVTACGAGD